MNKYGYARVSRKEQNLDLQIKALKEAGCTKIFLEKESGRHKNRVVLNRLFKIVKKGDCIAVYKIDRLARNASHVCEITEKMKEKGVSILSLTEGINTAQPMSELFCKLAGIFAEMEVNNLRERTIAGLTAAKAKGIKLGRPIGPIRHVSVLNEIFELYNNGMKVREISRKTKIPVSTIYRYIKLRYINNSQ